MPTVSSAPTPHDIALGLDHSLCFDHCELADQVGGMDATLMNGATCTPGGGVVFDGAYDYVDLVDQSLGGGPMTIAFYTRWDATNYYSRLCDFANPYGDENIIIGNVANGA